MTLDPCLQHTCHTLALPQQLPSACCVCGCAGGGAGRVRPEDGAVEGGREVGPAWPPSACCVSNLTLNGGAGRARLQDGAVEGGGEVGAAGLAAQRLLRQGRLVPGIATTAMLWLRSSPASSLPRHPGPKVPRVSPAKQHLGLNAGVTRMG